MATAIDENEMRPVTDPTPMLEKINADNVTDHLQLIAPSGELSKFSGETLNHCLRVNEELCDFLNNNLNSTKHEMLKQEEIITRLAEKVKRLQDALRKIQTRHYEEKKKAENYRVELEKGKCKEQKLISEMATILKGIKDSRLRNEIVHVFGPPLNLIVSQLRLTSVTDVIIQHETQTQVKQINKGPSSDDNAEQCLEIEVKHLKKIIQLDAEEKKAAQKDYDVTLQEIKANLKESEERLTSFRKRWEEAVKETFTMRKMLSEQTNAINKEKILYLVRSCILNRCVDDLICNGLIQSGDSEVLQKIHRATNKTMELAQMVESSEPSKLLDEIYQKLKNSPLPGVVPIDLTSPSHSPRTESKGRAVSDASHQTEQPKDAQKRLLQQRSARQAYYEAYRKSQEELEFERRHRDAYIDPFIKQNKKLVENLKVMETRCENMKRHSSSKYQNLKAHVSALSKNFDKMKRDVFKEKELLYREREHQDMLRAVHASTQRTHRSMRDLKRLKMKLFQVENDLKQL